jgi:hypothetical protein
MRKKKRPVKKHIKQNNLDWEPISRLQELTTTVDEAIKEAKAHEQVLINLSKHPDKYDAPSVNMVKHLNLEQLDIAQSYLEQGEHWKSEVRTVEEHFDVTLFLIQCRKLIDQLSNSNLVLIEKMCTSVNTNSAPYDLRDAELGLNFLLRETTK